MRTQEQDQLEVGFKITVTGNECLQFISPFTVHRVRHNKYSLKTVYRNHSEELNTRGLVSLYKSNTIK